MRENFLEVIRQNIAGWCQQTFCFQKFVYEAQQCFASTPQANFLAGPWFSLKGKVIGLNPGYLLKSFLLYLCDLRGCYELTVLVNEFTYSKLVYFRCFSKIYISMMFISHIYICSTSENPVWIDKYVFMNFLNFDVTHLSRFFFVSETWARRMRNKFRKYLLMYELSWIAELLKIIFGVTPWFWRSRYMTFFHDFFYIFCTHVLRTLAKLSYIPLITYCYLQVFFFLFFLRLHISAFPNPEFVKIIYDFSIWRTYENLAWIRMTPFFHDCYKVFFWHKN